ncbi:MAG: hypothetical protein ACO1NO_01005 [Burkholderiaceae bacterium]
MNTFLHIATLSGGMFLCSLAAAQPAAVEAPANKAEAAQLSQDMSPKARSQLARREAHAAYREAMSACKSMGPSERKGCAADAKSNLNNDLKYAKEIRSSGASMGASSGGSSVSGANDLSSAGGSAGTSAGRMGSSTGSSGASPGTGSSMSGMGSQSSQQSGQQMSGMSNDSSQASAPLTAAEKKQFVQTFTPQAQYNLAKREAHAAYAEALKECKAMERAERSACTKDARSMLQQDLAYAKRQMQESAGASSTEGGMSGSGSK